jgi:hypothetical protein
MSTMARNATIDTIAEQVRSLLMSSEGRKRLDRFNRLVCDVVRSLPTLCELRGRLLQRPSMQLYISTSSAKESATLGRVPLSVRVHGIECGVVTVGRIGPRQFEPRNRDLFASCGARDADGCEWGSSAVARYVEAAAALRVPRRPEAGVEAELIRAMNRPGAAWRGQQAVCLAGLPFSVPLPVSASSGVPDLGDGRIDVLARLGRGGKRLRVYELKAPKAPKTAVEGVLDQAVAYVAALKHVLYEGKEPGPWWRLIGFSAVPAHRPAFDAFAFVLDSPTNRRAVDLSLERLKASNSCGICLGAMYYRRDRGGGMEISVQ